MEVQTIQITYEFQFESVPARSYAMSFDAATMRMLSAGEAEPPEWAKLGFHQCSHCPLRSERSPHCPIARNLANVAEHFKGQISHHTAMVHVHTKERTYSRKVDLQTGLQSIFGLIMATSG